MEYARPVPAHAPQRRVQMTLGAFVALLLALGLFPVFNPPAARAASGSLDQLPVVIHFKDASGTTVDFAETSAILEKAGNNVIALLDPDGSLCLDEALSLAVYDRYASFNNQQRDLTDKCTVNFEEGTVAIPTPTFERSQALAVVIECAPSHPAYERFVMAELDTSPLHLEHEGSAATLESDIPDLLAQAQGDGAVPFSAAFPGTANTHYRLNPYTRLETFDTDMPRKQESYGIPSDLVGEYSFGVFFGASQHHDGNGVSTGTNFNDWVLSRDDDTFDAVVEKFLYETIAARNGANAAFATSRDDEAYRDRYITTGNDYKDAGYSAGSSPDYCAMAHGTCGKAGVSNGYGAVASNPNEVSYITYKGIYNDSQSQYAGWYKFYYCIAARSAKTHQEFQDIVGYLLVAPISTGSAQVVKTSTNTTLSTANANYSLEHAVFAAFASKTAAEHAASQAAINTWPSWQAARDWGATNAAFTLVTRADGTSEVVENIEEGDYYVCELFAPPGFRLNPTVKPVSVEASTNNEAICVVEFADDPKRGSIDLLKRSNYSQVTTDHPGYSLAGATYGVYSDAACTKLFREMRTALDENTNGYCRIDEVPIGTYWVREIKRPLEGYALDTRAYPVSVTDRVVTRVNTAAVTDKAKLNPFDIFIQKKDAQSKQARPQGAAGLENAHFRINYYPVKQAQRDELALLAPAASWVVRTDSAGAFVLDRAEKTFTHTNDDGTTQEVPYKVSGPAFYKLASGQVAMPIGTYTIQEVKAPDGYLLDPSIHLRHITDADIDGEIIETFEAEQGGDLIVNRVVRSDLQFTKRAEGASKLAGIPFKLTSKTTGEWHILVTDKNGLASTASSPAHPHSARTNGNDSQFRAADGSFCMPLLLDESQLDATCGTWFGLGDEGASVPIDDKLGALPYDTYELEELRCSANSLFRMICDEIVVGEHDEGATIDLGTLNNTAVGRPSLHTSVYDGATNSLYDSDINADTNATIIDRVVYSGLEPGATYTVTGTLMNRESGEPFGADGGGPVTTEVEFTPEDYNGYVNVPFSFDASSVSETTELVVFETLSREGIEMVAHHDIENRQQTITVNPLAIGTTALDSATGTHEGVPAEEVTLVDTVSYQGLTPGVEYELSALVMERESHEPWLVDDRVVMASRTFTPDAPSGEVDVEVILPGHNLDGVYLVVFESLLHDGREVALHADIDDGGQTVSYAHPEEPPPPPNDEDKPDPRDEPDPDPDEPAPDESAGDESEPTREPAPRTLAQTGDGLLAPFCLTAALAMMGAAIIVMAFRKRR